MSSGLFEQLGVAGGEYQSLSCGSVLGIAVDRAGNQIEIQADFPQPVSCQVLRGCSSHLGLQLGCGVRLNPRFSGVALDEDAFHIIAEYIREENSMFDCIFSECQVSFDAESCTYAVELSGGGLRILEGMGFAQKFSQKAAALYG